MNTLRLTLVLSVLAALAGPVRSQVPGVAEPASGLSPAQAEPAREADSPAAPAPAAAPAATAPSDDAVQDGGKPAARTQGTRRSPPGASADKAADPDPERLLGRPTPPALHLGSFASMRAARLTADGSLDTGAGVVQLIESSTDRQLAPPVLEYEKGPEFVVDWDNLLGDVSMSVRMLATGSVRNGDERTKALIHLTFANRTDEAHTVDFGLRVMAGGGDPALRPMPSLPFAPGSVFARNGNLVTRDGAVLLTWVGQDPADVNILPPPATPEAPAALLSWSLKLEPQTARYLDIFLAGPSASSQVDESAWRDAITRWSFAQVEEQLIWQSRFRGYYADIEMADPALRRALIGAVHLLRLCGDADREFRAFSDRPYGHPATDDAVPAEALGIMAEWSFGENAYAFVRTLVKEGVARGEALPPARRVAFVHGLARAVRLVDDTALAQQLAGVIRALATEPAEVAPWHDPAVVAQDLQGILDWAGPAPDGSDAGYALPALSWASAPAGRVEPVMLAMRRALSAQDGPAAWAALQELVAGTTVNGFGSLRDDGELDPRFSLGLMALVREMFIQDHGDDLHLFPLVPAELIPFPGALDLTTLATHFGLTVPQMHFMGSTLHTIGVQLKVVGHRPWGRLVVHVPYDRRAAEARGTMGGTAELLPDGSFECTQDPFMAKGLRFNIRLADE